MGYLISQIVSALIVASLLGMVLGWLLRGLAAAREMQRQEAIWQGRLRRAQQRGPTSAAVPVAEEPPPPTPEPAAASPDLEQARAKVESALSTLGRQLDSLSERLQRLEEPAPGEPAPTRPASAADPLDEVEARIRSTLATAPAEVPARAQPTPLPAPAADDLTRLRGVGPALSAALAALGVCAFATIAAWDEAEEERVVAELKKSYRGRIPRASWIAEARDLAAGGGGTATGKKKG